MKPTLPLLIALTLFVMPMLASAHLDLVQPPHRYSALHQKQPPCGKTGGERGDVVTVFEPGETITVSWNEIIDHPGHYRISFDADGDDGFVDPPCLADCDTRQPVIEMYSNDAVLLDNIPDKVGGYYEVEVTLPDVTCDNCTLQIIQVMYDKPPYTLPGNDLYYNCADLVLRAADPSGPGDAGDAGNHGDTGNHGDAGPDAGPGVPFDDAAGHVSTPERGQGTDGGCTQTNGAAPQTPLPALLVLVLSGLAVGRRKRRGMGRTSLLSPVRMRWSAMWGQKM